ncbi:hypothetical protein EN836_04715 [Mesorhizobium sp. M1C.F.Ca.ET.193.01.1.1]|uniref:hypothetical protein n=1 Tax=unclassified Mesorhizobium TaxID=325217 RepID=UPI000FD3DE47|nr:MULTISPECIES: hypothetical protein [unclassified Mesorhizobium]TGT03394.1 hypothetical protein EN820_20650 [bacterium M00.F.Ca.ET.177.01.1.1]TGQ56076.1 hypothetical protein EN853_04710 [Mesorhizobium sp. M1C.F.Ca.ET.210.01.1.1]TGQ75161.1 hypothetical protein EN855_004715 [Mesorhizobium sp. M1C.F.Ca.ET.212.01.1.1]TGR13573.1 hypothetical protein EN847_04715 [Mesorhizobium sp. M1C.F.Ca.ET.204.01.1.1]TGR33849.1 hypothetical protein EN839_04715 [Mesorhizobium sp. M1C.F.Ca.ET.196.01.1.1]
MRKFFTSLFAFILSGLAGALIVQELAVLTGATEEYMLVFAAAVMILIVVTIAFFLVQFRAEPIRAVDRVLWWLLAIFGIVLIALADWTFSVPAENRATASDLSIVAGLILPGAVAIIVQWLFVRWRLKRSVTTFGRGGAGA